MNGFHLDVPAFIDSLQYMWKGWLGVFLVIAIIILAIYLMNRGSSNKS